MSLGQLVTEEGALTQIAREMKTVAVVGIKDDRDPFAPAYTIPAMLQQAGVRVIGVTPRVPEALGEKTLASVAELPAGVDVLDVFRRPEAIPELADQLLELPAERRPAVVWMQSEIRHDGAAARLVAAGYRVVQDHCLGVYSRRAGRR